jgi:uncharacterized protein DUF4389
MEASATSEPHPIRVRVTDDLRRSRLTVFFRLLLVIPHLLWLSLWAILAILTAIVNWFATLFSGRSPVGIHNFLARFLVYSTHVTAYLALLANPYPGFAGKPGYPVDLVVAPPERQNRWKTGFRLLLAIPALLLTNVLQGVLQILAILGWFVSLALGRMPEGMRNLGVYCLRFQQQTHGYLLLLTDRYPSLSFPKVD